MLRLEVDDISCPPQCMSTLTAFNVMVTILISIMVSILVSIMVSIMVSSVVSTVQSCDVGEGGC